MEYAQKAEEAAQAAGQAQQILKPTIIQAQVLFQEERGEQAGRAISRTSKFAQAHRNNATRHSNGEPREAQKLILHDAQ